MVKVNLIGFKELEAKLKKAAGNIKKEVGAEVQFAGERFAELARKDAPKDTGQLTGSIRPKKIDELTVEVVAQKEYAPYVEWGTITKVNVPSEFAAYASQFMTKNRKRFNGGISPHPYFFKQIPIVRKETIQHIENILQDIL